MNIFSETSTDVMLDVEQNLSVQKRSRMSEWISCKNGFITADVIRWKEPVYERGAYRKKPLRIGHRIVTAEVLEDGHADGWARLLVRACEASSEKIGKDVSPLELETKVRRARRTILRGNPERLLWSDESAREIAASRFLGADG